MRMFVLALLVFMAGCGGCVSLPTFGALHSTTLRLDFQRGLCSGTAIGPDLVMTAQHCMDMGGPLTQVNGKPVKVTQVGRDKNDTLTLRITGVTFKHWARLGPIPHQGDRIRWWGNPEGNADVYREGYVARATDGLLVVDAPICHGDSGSGIFNDAGQVVAVVSAMTNGDGCTFMLAKAL
jgi:V8-like Glu-specific endopeptidase